MDEVVIRVRGEHERKVPAERGIVQLTVREQGPDPAAVRTRVERDAAALVDTVTPLHDEAEGPVRRYTVDQVRMSVSRPWNKGRQRPPVHEAGVALTVEFVDFTRLGTWLSGLAESETVQVGWIRWDLVDEHRREIERAVRQEALRQARQRAQDYADALDLGQVRPRMVADVGLLAEPRPPAPGGARMAAFAAASGGAADDEGFGALLQPDDIEVHASVEAEFVILPR